MLLDTGGNGSWLYTGIKLAKLLPIVTQKVENVPKEHTNLAKISRQC